ncbi:hypothetical protein Bca4012_083773 [Brassica carinata]|uniref:Uncharacterized protein n=1 Tax=Brassica carinata TaxID=52824 RepID=A0A8X7SKA2_BRACI|nr:hypothetical protein Bca52824_026973 [Brassica carinata]
MISKITKPETTQEVPVPTVFEGAITRQRAKSLEHKFNESMILTSDLRQVKPADEVTEEIIKKDALKIEDSSLKKDGPKRELAKKNQAPSEDHLHELEKPVLYHELSTSRVVHFNPSVPVLNPLVD